MTEILANKLPIVYSGYWDAPLAFVVGYKGETFLFMRDDFDDDLDEFPSTYILTQVKDDSIDQIRK